MSLALADLATLVGGTLVGDGGRAVSGAATLETAGAGDVTLVDAPERLHLLATSGAGAAIVPAGSGPLDRPTVEVADVHAAQLRQAVGHPGTSRHPEPSGYAPSRRTRAARSAA